MVSIQETKKPPLRLSRQDSSHGVTHMEESWKESKPTDLGAEIPAPSALLILYLSELREILLNGL